MPKSRRKPAYVHHRATGQARVRINGRDYYLGAYGTPASKAEYEDLLALWFRGRDISGRSLTVDELCLRFMDYAASYYRTPEGAPTSEISCLRYALRPLIKEFGATPVRDFTPKRLKALQQALIGAQHVRTSINRTIHRVRRVFRWGVSEELVPTEVYTALLTVMPLRANRSGAREAEPVQAVDRATVEATLPYLSPIEADMVRLQLLLGCRPGELCAMRAGEVARRERDVWEYRPQHHKTAHHGKDRTIFIGPAAQKLLQPYLDRSPEAYCFSPAESEERRLALRSAQRRTPEGQGNSRGTNRKARPKRQPGERFATLAFGRAIARAARRAGVPHWHPNQLRHTRATELREAQGIEAAQLVLGHSDPGTTLIYAEKSRQRTAELVRQVG